jgi:ankyrin repeat protein
MHLTSQEIATFASTNGTSDCPASRAHYRQDAKSENPKALRWAAQNGDICMLRRALEAGTDVDVCYTDEEIYYWVLHYATLCYDTVVEAVIGCLLEHEAWIDAGCVDAIGTPLQFACKTQNFRAAITLIEAGARLDNSLLCSCVVSIKGKSEGGFVPDEAKDEFAQLQATIISKLASLPGSLDWRTNGEQGQTPLMSAVRDGEFSTVQLLLNLGAKVDAQGGNNTTPLMCAVERRRPDCVELLLTAGADVNIKDRDGQSALEFMSPSDINERRCPEILSLLLKHGIDFREPVWRPDLGGHFSFAEAAYREATIPNGHLLSE